MVECVGFETVSPSITNAERLIDLSDVAPAWWTRVVVR